MQPWACPAFLKECLRIRFLKKEFDHCCSDSDFKGALMVHSNLRMHWNKMIPYHFKNFKNSRFPLLTPLMVAHLILISVDLGYTVGACLTAIRHPAGDCSQAPGTPWRRWKAPPGQLKVYRIQKASSFAWRWNKFWDVLYALQHPCSEIRLSPALLPSASLTHCPSLPCSPTPSSLLLEAHPHCIICPWNLGSGDPDPGAR